MPDPIPASRPLVRSFAVVALLLCAGGAFAQDSVSRNANGGNGLPGDGLSPYTSTTQRLNYVVDLSPLTTSWGTQFGIAPLLKSSRTSATRFSAVTGPSTISQAIATGVAFPASSFTLWTQPGGGLSTGENNIALNTSVSPSGQASVFGVGFLDFDETTSGTSVVLGNFLHGAQVAFDPSLPTRLFVTRTVGALNQLNATQLDRSQFGLGSIDAEGNLCFRADGYNAASGTTVLQGDNYFRVRLPARLTSGANIIDNNGAGNASASDWLLQRSNVTHAVPTAIPQTLAGRSVLVGPDFAGLLKLETTGGSLAGTTSNRPQTLDQRGPVTFSAAAFNAGSVGTLGVLSRSSLGGGRVDSISLAGVNASGGITAARTITLPATLADTCDGTVWNLSGGGFRGYDSQITFRGGVGPAAIAKDASGNLLASGVLYSGTTPDSGNPFNAIVVGRFNPASANSPVAWTVAAWVDTAAGTGKAIRGDFGLDGAPNTNDAGENDGVIDANDAPIGRLASLSETTLGLSGPSVSSPAFDAAGNIYFVGSGLFRRFNGTSVVQEFGLGLFRGVYNASQMCYTLDLVARVGDTFPGANSGRNYQIQSLALADGDSISSASLSSSNSLQQGWNNIDVSGLPAAAPQNLGGLVVDARIVYDTNNDGSYQDPTQPGGNLNSPDEAYNVVLYIGNTTPPEVGPPCDADVNQDGVADQGDVDYLINVIAGGENPTGIDADFNQDGVADQGDVDALVNVVAGGPCP